ncbi:unnamed protein product [Mortierella alpina]
MPWPWDPPPPPALDAVSTPHDDHRSTSQLSIESKHPSDTSAQTFGHSSPHQRDEGDSQALENKSTLCLGDFGTVLSFLQLEKRHFSMSHSASTSAQHDPRTSAAPSSPHVADVALVGTPSSNNGLWDLSMAMRYLEAHRTPRHSEPNAILYSHPPLTLSSGNHVGSHHWTTKVDLTEEISHDDDAVMATSADISVNHTDDGTTALITLYDQSQGIKGDGPGNDGLVELAGARRRIKKKSARPMPIDEPSSSSNGGGHSSESEHKGTTEPGSGSDEHSDTPSRYSMPAGLDKQGSDLNLQSRAIKPAKTLATPNTVSKKKRPWRAAKVLKEMKALFLAEQREQQERHARQKLLGQVVFDRQKRGDSTGQVPHQELCGTVSSNGLIPIASGEEQESVIEHTPGCEPFIFQRPRSHYRNFWRPWEQDPTMEDGPTLPSLACTTFASTTSTQSLSEEQCAGKKLLAMRVRDTFLVPNGVSHLVNALSQANADAHIDADKQTNFANEDTIDGDEDDGGGVEKGPLKSAREFDSEPKTSFAQVVDTKVTPSERVFIFVDNSNILTGFYQHHQLHSSAQKGQGSALESPSVETVQMSPSASPLAATHDIPPNTPDGKQNFTDTDSDEEIVLYPCPHRDKAKLAKASTNGSLKEYPKDSGNKGLPLTEIKTTDNHNDTFASAAMIDDQSRSYKTPTAPSGAKMVRGSHLLPKFDYNKFFELLRKNRPAARQVLVGSSPLFQELDEALEHQYETIILRRVRKFVQGELGALPVPVKQPRYPSNSSNNSNNNSTAAAAAALPGSSGGAVDVSELPDSKRTDANGTQHSMATATFAEASALPPAPTVVANGEQGVDELLHLKMLETLLDHEPATMVLATGDGGDSEFGGGGFYGVIRRALDRGWQVEVVSWEDLLSGAYLELALEYGYADPDHRSGSTRRPHHQPSHRPAQQHHHQPHHQLHPRVPKTRIPPQGRSAPSEGRRTQGHLRVWCLDWYGDLFLQKVNH